MNLQLQKNLLKGDVFEMFDLSEKLKSLRRDKGVSQEKLATHLGVTFQAVSKWENGGTYPDISLLPDIARFYNITVDETAASGKARREASFRGI